MKDKSDDDDQLPTLIEQPSNEAGRKAAWEAFKALRNAGWRSDGPYPSREELHERGSSKWRTPVKTPPSGEQD